MTFASKPLTHRFPQHEQDITRETAWFFRLNPFQREHARRQAKFKQRHWPELHSNGGPASQGHVYPDRLQKDGSEDGGIARAFFDRIADDAMAYLSSRPILSDPDLFNLRSSLAACFNFLFPLRQDPPMAARALRPLLPGVRQVRGIEFGFTGTLDSDGPAKWLGEPSKTKRAQNRTLIDAAVWWTDGQHNRLTLVDWKYTESGYPNCPGFESCRARRRNVWIRRCTNIHTAEIQRDPEHRCFMSCGETNTVSRRYWERMPEAGIRCDMIGMSAQGCAFRGPLHSHIRQWLLAQYMREHPVHDETHVDVCLVHFTANRALLTCPFWMVGLGRTLPAALRAVVSRPENYRTCTIEDLMSAVDESVAAVNTEWREYLRERYGI